MTSMHLFRAACLSALLCALGEASGVSTDGSQYYFVSDIQFAPGLPVNGTSHSNAHNNVYRWTSNGVELIAQGPLPLDYEIESGSVSVSGDGSVVSYTAVEYRPYVVPLKPPTTLAIYISVIKANGSAPITVYGRLFLSRSGRYALLGPSSSTIPSSSPVMTINLLDIATGERTQIEPGLATSLSSDGHVLVISSATDLRLWSKQASEVLPVQGALLDARINDQGSTVVYYASLAVDGEQEKQLHAIDLASHSDTLIDNGVTGLLDISDDGSIVMYQRGTADGPQLFLAGTDGGQIRQLTDPGSGVGGQLSGNGNVVYASTYANFLVRRDVPSGTAQELIGRVARTDGFLPGHFLVPGSLYRLIGSGLTGDPETALVDGIAPLPESLGGVRIKIGNGTAKLVQVAPDVIWFQVPFDTPLGSTVLGVSTEAPVDPAPARVEVQGLAPAFWPNDTALWVWHTGFDSPVTYANPAQPGEVVHLIMAGLGPVQPVALSGLPAPISPLTQLTNPLTCVDLSLNRSLDILFAGLAPGLIGVYQVDVRLSSFMNPGLMELQVKCGFGSIVSPTILIPYK